MSAVHHAVLESEIGGHSIATGWSTEVLLPMCRAGTGVSRQGSGTRPSSGSARTAKARAARARNNNKARGVRGVSEAAEALLGMGSGFGEEDLPVSPVPGSQTQTAGIWVAGHQVLCWVAGRQQASAWQCDLLAAGQACYPGAWGHLSLPSDQLAAGGSQTYTPV